MSMGTETTMAWQSEFVQNLVDQQLVRVDEYCGIRVLVVRDRAYLDHCTYKPARTWRDGEPWQHTTQDPVSYYASAPGAEDDHA